MSNNKQSRFEDLEYWKNNAEENYMTTPISVLKYIHKLEEHIETIKAQLPSNEEIEREARLYCNIKESLVIDEEERYYKDFQKYDGFKACAKWMRDKLQGGNNEQQ